LTPEEFLEHINRPLGEKIEESYRIIKKYKKHSAVAWSGGKDSTTLVVLVSELGLDIPVIYNNLGVEFPETVQYVRNLAKKLKINFIEIRPKKTFWELPKNVLFGEIHGKNSCCRILKVTPLNRFMKKLGVKTQFIGSRWDEGRRWTHTWHQIVLKNIGTFKEITRVYPIAYWNTDQVYEFLSSRNIPVNSLYSKGWVRQGCFVCPACPESLLKQHYPKFWELRERARKMYPKLFGDFPSEPPFERQETGIGSGLG
jgi:phosphoadenosine phosphosulfate reductase